jgi:hypothetical protein
MKLAHIGKASVKSRHRLPQRIILVCGFILVVVYVLFGTVEWRRRQYVRELISDVQGLQVNQISENEVGKLAQKYHGEYFGPVQGRDSHAPANYLIGFWSPGITFGDRKHALPGRRLWGATAYLPLENGVLSSVHFGIGVYRADGVTLSSKVVMTGIRALAAPEGVSYFIYQSHVTGPPTESLSVELSPAATPAERKKAFTFNLSCLSSLQECKHVCELMPRAWNDFPSERRRFNDNGGITRDDSRCP